jgi:Tfp pilus assembly protein PilZ
MGEEEKRSSVRIPVQLTVRFSLRGKDYTGTALNLSNDGIFLKATELFQNDEILEIVFDLPESKKVRLRSRVVWGTWIEGISTPAAGMGIRFEPSQSEQKDEMHKFIQHLLSHP